MAGHGKQTGKKAIVAAFVANLGIMLAKILGFIFTGAASMLAEAVHSFADTSNQGLLLLGGKLASRKASDAHQFGYGRERYFWSFIVAMMIFALGSLFAIYEGIEKILHPHELDSHYWAIGILLFAIVLESYSMRTAIVEANKIRGSQSIWSFIRTSKVPELPVVLLEDLGALVGLILALVGIGLALMTGDARYDAVGSLAIGILLGIIAVILWIEMRSLLLGEAASSEVTEEIRSCIESQPAVKRLIHMRTEHIGPDRLLVALKVEFAHEMTAKEIAEEIDACEAKIREKVKIADVIYIEPDIYKEEK